MTPGPPALVTMASRFPNGSRCIESVFAQSNSSPISLTRTIPARLKAASKTASSPATLPVCESAALAPPAVLPALSTMIGFVRANARAALRKRRASESDSM